MVVIPKSRKRYSWRSSKYGDVTVMMTDDKSYEAFESTVLPSDLVLKTRRGPPGMREVIIESGRLAGQNAFVSLSELHELM